MNSKWWFRGSSGPVSCSCQTSVWRLRGAGNGLLRPLLGRRWPLQPGRVPRRTVPFTRAVPPPASGCLLACVSLRRRPSVCVTGGCVRVTVCVYRASESAIRAALQRAASGVADHRGLLRARWLGEAPCVCMRRYGGRRARRHREKTPRSVARGRHGGTRAGVCVTLGASCFGLLFCYPPRRWRVARPSARPAPVFSRLVSRHPASQRRVSPWAPPFTGGSHPYAPLAPHPCVRRGSERAFGRRVCCPPSSHSSSQEISALCPTLCGHGGSREMR